MPTGSTSTDSTVGTATGTTAEVDSTINNEVVRTCTTGTLALPDAELCQKFLRDTCGCTRNAGKACSGLFSLDHYIELQAQASFLTHDELDLTLMGSIMSTLLSEDVAWNRHKPTKRIRL